MKANMPLYYLEERRILLKLISEDGMTIMCKMKNRLNVLGTQVDPFHDTAVATFNEKGLITQFKLYNCRSPIIGIVQMATGKGPYVLSAAREELE
ncbi:hypothetical protein LSUE1_G008766 [Lachnellula suecica]|uniref:Uncharacterized protein n=1 Tax=Lachnellula suecica TaxID=602035 RepID=A0A8T9C6V0_9HELO|nr:hypothetical protein LSUE1_G008766 [Lachnellula suecica]